METVSPGRERRSKILIGCLTLGAAIGIVWMLLGGEPLSGLKRFRSGAAVVPVKLSIIDQRFQPLPAGSSRFSVQAVPTPSGVPNPKATPIPTNLLEINLVKRTPAVTMQFHRGAEALRWFDENPEARKFFDSAAVKGALHEVLETLKVRTDDLDLGSTFGLSIEMLAREALAANGILYFDPFEGSRGFVISFERGKAPLVSRVLPPAVAALSRRAYDVTGASAPVEEITVGRQALFLTEDRGRVFVSSGLKSMLNVLDFSEERLPAGAAPALTIALHAEAFVDRLLPLVAGRERFAATWGFSFPAPSAPAELELALDAAKVFSRLSPKMSPGVFAATPADAFAVFAASFKLPADMTPEAWNQLATAGTTSVAPPAPEGGIALIWDISSEDPSVPTDVGLVISMPDSASAIMKPADYFDEEVTSTDECGGGSVWIASNNELLLTRMKEACDRQSVSVLNWFESKSLPFAAPDQQLFLAVNPGVALKEAQELGLAARNAEEGADDAAQPEWKKRYEEAVTRSAAEAEVTLAGIPTFIYAGTASETGSVLKGVVRWNDRK